MPDKSANTIAKAIYENHVLTFGPMKIIKTDVGSEYNNNVIKKLCEFMKTDHRVSTAYHHQTIGTVERSHSSLNAYIRAYLLEMKDDWDSYLRYFTYAYNISKHSSLSDKYSPFELVFAKIPTQPHEILSGRVEPLCNIDNYAYEAKYRLQIAHKDAKNIIEKIKIRSKEYYDRNVNKLNIKVNDLVKINKEPYEKLGRIKDGPFRVVEINSPNATIELENGKFYTIHNNRLTKYSN